MKELNYRQQSSNFFDAIKKVGVIELKALNNNRPLLYSQLMVPVLYYLFYSIGISTTFGNVEYHQMEVPFLQFSFIGIVGLTVYSQLSQSVYRIILDRKWGLLAFKYFKGVSPLAFMLGKLIFPLMSFFLQLFLLYMISVFVGETFSISMFGILLLLSIVLMLFWFSIGVMIALRINSYQTRDLLLNTLMIPIAFTAPTFFTFDYSPQWIQIVSKINPLTYQLDALRDIAFSTGQWINVVISILLTVVTVVIATYSIKNATLTSDEH